MGEDGLALRVLDHEYLEQDVLRVRLLSQPQHAAILRHKQIVKRHRRDDAVLGRSVLFSSATALYAVVAPRSVGAVASRAVILPFLVGRSSWIGRYRQRRRLLLVSFIQLDDLFLAVREELGVLLPHLLSVDLYIICCASLNSDS